MDCQVCIEDGRAVQVLPESSDVHILPGLAHAATFVPSEDDVIDCQVCIEDGRDVQLSPESSDVHILPP